MPLNNGIDTVSFLTFGVYSETFDGDDDAAIASLFVTLGLLENAPAPPEASGWFGFIHWLFEFF